MNELDCFEAQIFVLMDFLASYTGSFDMFKYAVLLHALKPSVVVKEWMDLIGLNNP